MSTATMMTAVKWVLVAVAVALIVPLAGLIARGAKPDAAPSPRASAQEPGPTPGPALTLEVVDLTDLSPLRGAVVWVRGRGGRTHTWEGTTDAQGRYAIVPPDEATRFFDIVAASAGYVPSHYSTGFNGANVLRVVLQRAEAIGGVVRDEQGRPIAGARVAPKVFRFDEVFWPEMYASVNSERAIATTDAQGRWRSEALPVGTFPPTQVRVLVMHPDHVTGASFTTAGEARELSSVQVMKPGVSISGTVLSPFGRTVREATVVVARPPRDGTFLRLTTDKDGRFRSSRCIDPDRPGLVLLVQASGLAWAIHHVDMKPEIPSQVIRLTGRRPVEGRVVDARGGPMAGAFVWSNREAFGGLIEWEAETDANGRFVWYDAPTTGKLYLDVLKPTFPLANGVIVRPGTDEITVIIRR